MANHAHTTTNIAQHSPPSRRALFSAATALALVTPAVAADFTHMPPIPGRPVPLAYPGVDDRYLIELCSAYVGQWTSERRAWVSADADGRRQISSTAVTAMFEAAPGADPMWQLAGEISRLHGEGWPSFLPSQRSRTAASIV